MRDWPSGTALDCAACGFFQCRLVRFGQEEQRGVVLSRRFGFAKFAESRKVGKEGAARGERSKERGGATSCAEPEWTETRPARFRLTYQGLVFVTKVCPNTDAPPTSPLKARNHRACRAFPRPRYCDNVPEGS